MNSAKILPILCDASRSKKSQIEHDFFLSVTCYLKLLTVCVLD